MDTDVGSSVGGGGPPSRGPTVVAVISSVVVGSLLAVTLRFFARGVVVKRIGWDDWLIALAWLLSFGMSFSICYGELWGGGGFFWRGRKDQIVGEELVNGVGDL